MMLRLIALVASMIICSQQSFADVVVEGYCFSSDNNKQIRFELRTYFDMDSQWRTAYVKYAKAKTPIPLILATSKSMASKSDRPDASTRSWTEFSNGQASGTYQMTSQGGSVSEMTYTNTASHKQVGFILDANTEFDPHGGCRWDAR